jgi:hypothetical protein
MINKEEIRSILEDYYPNINEFLGDLVEQRLKSPNYEDSTLISRLLKASSRLPTLKKDEEVKELEEVEEEDFDVEYFGDHDYEDEYDEQINTSFRLDSGLYVLDSTLFHGKKYCEGFNCIFQDVNLSKPQEVDNRMMEILVQVKAFEFLSKSRFRQITAIGSKQNRSQVDFIGNMHKVLYAIVSTRLYSAQRIEEHLAEYGEHYVIISLKSDITHAIDQKYPQLANVYRTRFGIDKGIIFISSGRDYFGHIKYENSLYGLQPSKIHAVLNKVWATQKSRAKSYKYLHHIVITTGRKIENAIAYPIPNWEQIS